MTATTSSALAVTCPGAARAVAPEAPLATTVVLSTIGGVSGAASGGSPANPTSSARPVTAPKDAVDITMTEYAFAVSGPLKSGGTVRMRNTGKELHMLGIGRIGPGKTLSDVRKALDIGGPDALAKVVRQLSLPGALVPPGHAVEITVPTLSAGTYALLCFAPTEGESLPHTAHGMVAELTVVAAKAAPPKPDAVYTVTADKPIVGPATLKAGHLILRIDARPGTDALELGVAPAPNGKTLEAAVAEVQAQFTKDGGLAKGSGQTSRRSSSSPRSTSGPIGRSSSVSTSRRAATSSALLTRTCRRHPRSASNRSPSPCGDCAAVGSVQDPWIGRSDRRDQ